MRSSLQPAFVLHSRPFNETSSLLDVFTGNYGRIKLIARAARSSRSRFRGVLRPFNPLLISWVGKTELMSLTAVEHYAPAYDLSGAALLSALYLNELLVKLLLPGDPHVALFNAYQDALQQLEHPVTLEKSLRLFEKKLLDELGYGLTLDQEAESGVAVIPEGSYQYLWGQGLRKENACAKHALVFQGRQLLAFHQERLENKEDLRCAKRLTRYAINVLLGEKKLKSRDLFF